MLNDVQCPYKLKDTDMVISGDKQIEFKSPADAERWYAQNVSGDYKKYVAHSIVSISSGARLLLGPADYGWLLLLCADGKPSCQITGKLP